MRALAHLLEVLVLCALSSCALESWAFRVGHGDGEIDGRCIDADTESTWGEIEVGGSIGQTGRPRRCAPEWERPLWQPPAQQVAPAEPETKPADPETKTPPPETKGEEEDAGHELAAKPEDDCDLERLVQIGGIVVALAGVLGGGGYAVHKRRRRRRSG